MSIDDYTKEGDQLSMFDNVLNPAPSGYNPKVEKRKNQERMDDRTKESIKADVLRTNYLVLKNQYDDLSRLVEGLNKNVDAEPVEKLKYLSEKFPRFSQNGNQPLHGAPLQKIPVLYKNLIKSYKKSLSEAESNLDVFKEKNPSYK